MSKDIHLTFKKDIKLISHP